MAAAQSTSALRSITSAVSTTSQTSSPQTTLPTAASTDEMSSALLPSSSNSSTTATHPMPTDDAPPAYPLAPATSSGTSTTKQDRVDGLLNYYFIFLALFVILLLGGMWFIHRRKKQRKARLRNSGQNALARDLHGLGQPRRWMHGVAPWRSEGLDTGREEGLNELGEAPPAYTKDMGITSNVVSVSTASTEGASDPAPMPVIPLRTLSTNERERLRIRPPGYEASISSSLAPTSGHSRPGSVLPSSSTENLSQPPPWGS